MPSFDDVFAKHANNTMGKNNALDELHRIANKEAAQPQTCTGRSPTYSALLYAQRGPWVGIAILTPEAALALAR
jgi:hypothetical protein